MEEQDAKTKYLAKLAAVTGKRRSKEELLAQRAVKNHKKISKKLAQSVLIPDIEELKEEVDEHIVVSVNSKEEPVEIIHDFSFSKINFGTVPTNTGIRERKVPKHVLLKKLERKQKRLSTLTIENQKSKKLKVAEENAIRKASGVKLRDDISLLKKTFKRKYNDKKRSSKVWEQRRQNQKVKTKETIKKKEANMKQRCDGKRDRKIARRKKSLCK